MTYNYSAEYGERAGPTVLVTTKSGSNQWHGSLFEFFRNTDLDATRYFLHAQAKIQSEPVWRFAGRPDSRKTRRFSLLDYQAKMQREGVPFTGFVPTTAMTTPDANGDYDFSTDPFG